MVRAGRRPPAGRGMQGPAGGMGAVTHHARRNAMQPRVAFGSKPSGLLGAAPSSLRLRSPRRLSATRWSGRCGDPRGGPLVPSAVGRRAPFASGSACASPSVPEPRLRLLRAPVRSDGRPAASRSVDPVRFATGGRRTMRPAAHAVKRLHRTVTPHRYPDCMAIGGRLVGDVVDGVHGPVETLGKRWGSRPSQAR